MKCRYCANEHSGFNGCAFWRFDFRNLNRAKWLSEGHEMVSPGIYTKDGTMHFDIPELLDTFGWEDTEENRDKLVEICNKIAGEVEAPIVNLHTHICPRCRKSWEHETCIKPTYATCDVCNS